MYKYNDVVEFLYDCNHDETFSNLGIDLVNKKTKCPFKDENTPSCHVYEPTSTSWSTYYCFGCGASGDLYELLGKKLNLSNHEALREVLGIKSNGSYSKTKTNLASIKFIKLVEGLKDNANTENIFYLKCKKYLNDRLVTDEMIEKHKLSFFSVYTINSTCKELNLFYNIHPESILIPFIEQDGNIVYGIIKELSGAYKYPFNHPTKTYTLLKDRHNIKSLVICEGQFDAMHLFNRYPDSKIIASGGASLKGIKNEIDNYLVMLDETCNSDAEIIICPDTDSAGSRLCEKLIKYIISSDIIGFFNIKILIWNGDAVKDYNDALIANCEFKIVSFLQWLVTKRKIEDDSSYMLLLNRIKDYFIKHTTGLLFLDYFELNKPVFHIDDCPTFQMANDLIIEDEDKLKSDLSFHNIYLDNNISVRTTGFLICLAGMFGSGKTRFFVHNIIHNLKKTTYQFLILSFDMREIDLLKVIKEYYYFTFNEVLQVELLDRIIFYTDQNRHIDTVSKILTEKLIENPNIKCVYVDNLDKINGVGKDRWSEEDYICQKLVDIKKKTNVCIWLLIQTNKESVKPKRESESFGIGLGEVSGSNKIGSHCDVVITMCSKTKEKKKFIVFRIRKNRYGFSEQDSSLDSCEFGQIVEMEKGIFSKNYPRIAFFETNNLIKNKDVDDFETGLFY
ncbi:MAG: CHC2 zinc finger domain-containing protein [Turicibacter sp.]